MGPGTNLIASIIAALVVAGAATYYFWFIQRRRDETAAGIVALSDVSWRGFIHMVLDALSRRGFDRVVDKEEASGDRDFTLQREREYWLLSCKHGSAFVLGKPDVQSLASEIQMKGAVGGFLLTQGRILPDAHAYAAQQRVELLDGQRLWPELRDFIPAEQRNAIAQAASQKARQRTLLACLLALLVAVAVYLLMPSGSAGGTTTNPGQPEAQVPVATEAADVQAPLVITPELRAQQREDVLKAISTLKDVDRAIWSSESTLQVFLVRIDGDAFSRICPLMEHYPAVATSRIQLTPPTGSGAVVRFRQCRTY